MVTSFVDVCIPYTPAPHMLKYVCVYVCMHMCVYTHVYSDIFCRVLHPLYPGPVHAQVLIYMYAFYAFYAWWICMYMYAWWICMYVYV